MTKGRHVNFERSIRVQHSVTWKMVGVVFLTTLTLLLGLYCGSYFLWSRSMNATINGPRDVAGPGLRSNLVVYFRRTASSKQIEDFHNTVVSTPGQTSHETQLLPGVAGSLAIRSADGHSGVAIDFSPIATTQERTTIKSRIEASPIVLKLFENTIPNQIMTIDEE